MSIETQITEAENDLNLLFCDVRGDSIDEIVEYMRHRIRPKSRACYLRDMPADLAKGNAIVDQHAGMGTFYTLHLR